MDNKDRDLQLKYQIKKLVFFGVSFLIVIMAVLLFQQSQREEDVISSNVAENVPDAIGNVPVDVLGHVVENIAGNDTSPLEYGLYDSGFLLSARPGFYEEAFDLIVTIPAMPDAVIYFTIDGNEPMPGEDMYVDRWDGYTQVSGRVPETGQLRIEDRSGHWRGAILAYYSHQWPHAHGVVPAQGANILQGTSFRFRGFIDGEPVTEIITATYIIAEDAYERFAGMPIVAITAPYEDFIYVYRDTNRFAPTPRRRVFHYEYFEHGENGYVRVFDMPGSTSLGGNGSRSYAQRTMNVHVARNELSGVITHPIFPGVDELRRFRLWNGGNAFHWCHMRDTFAQAASAGLHVITSEKNLAVKFINGEYWGFTTMREHSSNGFFIHTKTGLDRRNVIILDSNNSIEQMKDGRAIIITDVQEGPHDLAMEFYHELIDFAKSQDMSTDYARERLFNEFFCEDNFIDYMIAQTFFHNADWPHHNLRFFRAIDPNLESGNPYEDGRWRFILHDLDAIAHPLNIDPGIGIERYMMSRFDMLYRVSFLVPAGRASEINYVFLVFNNPAFVERFVERALYVLDTHFRTDVLLDLHEEFVSRYRPLLPEMYNRFAIVDRNVEASIANFEYHSGYLRHFIINRDYYYRRQLVHLLERLG